MPEREEKTFNDNLAKDFRKDTTSLKKRHAVEFACEPDARADSEKWIQTHSRYRFRVFKIIPVTRKTEKRRGRPKVGDPVVISFSISATIDYKEGAIDHE
jgi:transposase